MIWDVGRRERIGTPLEGNRVEDYPVRYSLDGATLVSPGSAGGLSFWNVATHRLAGKVFAGATTPVVFHPGANLFAAQGRDYSVVLIDAISHQQVRKPFQGHTAFICGVSTWVAGVGRCVKWSIAIWTPANGRCTSGTRGQNAETVCDRPVAERAGGAPARAPLIPSIR